MLWFNFILGLIFFELLSILLPLFQIMVINIWQKKIKIEPVLKIFTKTKFKPKHEHCLQRSSDYLLWKCTIIIFWKDFPYIFQGIKKKHGL